jgi:hypothetical protein
MAMGGHCGDAGQHFWNWPAAPLLRAKLASPVPVSMATSLEPVLTTHGQ